MRHPFHLVEQSPWPILLSLNLLFTLLSLVSYLNGYNHSLINVRLGIVLLTLIILLWFYDIITESLYMGFHSFAVSKGLILAFFLFLATEVLLFVSFFWGYFHSAFNPTDLIWPPVGVELINPWSIPFLNTLLLLYSGIAATWAHHSFISSDRVSSLKGLSISIFLGVIFFILQLFEYFNSTYDISDSVYSSAFYLLTGMHGFHVVVGVSLIIAVFIRLYLHQNPTVFYDLALIYYHFIDIVWIALFILIYYMAY